MTRLKHSWGTNYSNVLRKSNLYKYYQNHLTVESLYVYGNSYGKKNLGQEKNNISETLMRGLNGRINWERIY